MQSEFGRRVLELCKATGIKRFQLARAAGVSPSVIYETLRDLEWARKAKKRALPPKREHVETWATTFGLSPADRRDFLLLAGLSVLPSEYREVIADVLAEQEERLEELTKRETELRALLRALPGPRPTKR